MRVIEVAYDECTDPDIYMTNTNDPGDNISLLGSAWDPSACVNTLH